MKRNLLNLAIACLTVSLVFSSCNKKEDTLSVVAPVGQIGERGGPITFSIQSNTNWTISKPAGDTWITSISPDRGTGSQTITVTAEANNAFSSRESILTVKTADSNKEEKVVVKQDTRLSHYYFVGNTLGRFPAAGGAVTQGRLVVSSDIDWVITEELPVSGWITEITPSSYKGTLDNSERIEVVIKVAPNTTGAERKTVLVLTNAFNVSQNINITQLGE